MTQRNRFLNSDEPKKTVDTVSLECFNQFEALENALQEPAEVLVMKLHSILSIVHLCGLFDNAVPRWDELRNVIV